MNQSSIKLEEWCTLYPPGHIPQGQLFGYENQMKALKTISINQGICHKVLFFGVPGNGKTNFSAALANSLSEEGKMHYALEMISSDKIPAELRDSDLLIRSLERAVGEALKQQPVIICFDEIDFMTPKLNTPGLTPHMASLCAWVRRFLNNDNVKSSKALIVGVTNNPSMIELSVINRFKTGIYFEPTPPAIIELIIKNNLTTNKEVSDKFLRKVNGLGFWPMGRDVMNSCMSTKECYDGDITKIPTEMVASTMVATIGMPLPKRAIDEFEHDEANLIEQSKRYTIPYWIDFYEKIKA
ncbi:MAG: ATP-binding protein [Candidatus Bathyarchaeota archaeon]|nr:ATP-binding protein [Candidatus Bathyarchaeota archaeon]